MGRLPSTCPILLAFLGIILATNANIPDVAMKLEVKNKLSSGEERPVPFVSRGLESFGLELLKETVKIGGPKLNLVLSPFSVWALLVLLTEGSRANTREQLLRALRLPRNRDLVISGYRDIEAALKVNTTTVSVETAKAIFSDLNRPVQPDFEFTADRLYECPVLPVNFQHPMRTKDFINAWVRNGTHGRISELVHEGDLMDAQMIMVNAVYFRGQWTLPFQSNLTKREAFYDENGIIVGEVDMMYSKKSYALMVDPLLDALVVEIPYGKENRLSMIAMLPRFGNTVDKVLEKLPGRNLSQLQEALAQSHAEYIEDEVDLRFPKFKTSSDLVLNVVLDKMGIVDVFHEETADLSGISPHKIFLSRVIHKSEIVVDEEGTVAAAATGGTISNKSQPPRFYANKPFIYFIYEKTSNTIVFAGKMSGPG